MTTAKNNEIFIEDLIKDLINRRNIFAKLPYELAEKILEYKGVLEGGRATPYYDNDVLVIPVNYKGSFVPLSKNVLRPNEKPQEITEVENISKIIMGYGSKVHAKISRAEASERLLNEIEGMDENSLFGLGSGNDPHNLHMMFFAGRTIELTKNVNDQPVIKQNLMTAETFGDFYKVSPYGDLGVEITLESVGEYPKYEYQDYFLPL